MKALFINPQQEMADIRCLSALPRRVGHETARRSDPRLFGTNLVQSGEHLIRSEVRAERLSRITKQNPDPIGFTVVTDTDDRALRWTRRFKRRFDIPMERGNTRPTFILRLHALPETRLSHNGRTT